MKRLMGRRVPLLVVVVAVACLASVAAVAVAGLRPADLTFTPRSERDTPNIDVARAWAKNYYGAPTAVTGSGATATWSAPLNLDSNYAHEARSVASDGTEYLQDKDRGKHDDKGNGDNKDKDRHSSAKKAIVLDVDDTTLTTWNYELFSNWDFNPTTNANFVGLTGTTFTGNMFPATPGMVDMVNTAKSLGYAIFFVTGRGDAQHAATIANLVNDAAAGLPDITSETYAGKTVPEVDAGYPAPTAIDTGHGGFTDGLFTKPPVGSYPAYLDKPEFCAPSIHATPAPVSCPTIQYKSGTRAYIESKGFEIVANFGDQFSDLEGGFANKTFKMPNPNYYLP